ncbi:MAG: TrkH family potassium uptake protein, partial [Candidatus Marinimicrobia bacterium]|nr:TrkH family potassium uptake protein [Candidatus Neomarinimicrobiota bacterium]
MRFFVVLRYTVLTFPISAIFLLISGGIAWFHGTPDFVPLIFSAVIALVIGVFPMLFVPRVKDISNKEGLLIVVLSWFTAS